MSVFTLLFGQCGIQVGQEFFATLYEDTTIKLPVKPSLSKEYVSEATKRWFRVTKRGTWLPRSILVDTETATIPAENKNYKFTNVLSRPLGGSANNWACGYCSRSAAFIREIEEKLRKEFEDDHEVTNILCVHSSSGGTGSGVGTKTVQHIRDHFPDRVVINVVVLPYSKGEVAVQSYNTLLTLSKLYDVTDALLLFENDKLNDSLKRSQISNVGFQHLNSLISEQLAITLQPIKYLPIQDLVKSLSPQDTHKLVQLQSASVVKEEHKLYENTISWSSLLKSITRANRCSGRSTVKSVSDVLISRGGSEPSETEMKLIASDALQNFHQSRPFRNESQSVTLLSNNTVAQHSLNSLLEDAWKQFTHGAYLHHYSKYGVDEQYFLNAFERLETVLYDYKNL